MGPNSKGGCELGTPPIPTLAPVGNGGGGTGYAWFEGEQGSHVCVPAAKESRVE